MYRFSIEQHNTFFICVNKSGKNKRIMKVMKNKALFPAILVMISCILAANVASAVGPIWTPGRLNSGYGITTDYHGIDVPVGTPVTAYAATTKNVPGEVKYVCIIWLEPGGSVARNTGPLPLEDSGTKWTDDKEIYWATDTFIPNIVGDWGVQAIFYNLTLGKITCEPPHNEKEAIRATSFLSVPEVPLGTITATLVMMGTLVLLAVKNKSNLKIVNRIN